MWRGFEKYFHSWNHVCVSYLCIWAHNSEMDVFSRPTRREICYLRIQWHGNNFTVQLRNSKGYAPESRIAPLRMTIPRSGGGKERKEQVKGRKRALAWPRFLDAAKPRRSIDDSDMVEGGGGVTRKERQHFLSWELLVVWARARRSWEGRGASLEDFVNAQMHCPCCHSYIWSLPTCYLWQSDHIF